MAVEALTVKRIEGPVSQPSPWTIPAGTNGMLLVVLFVESAHITSNTPTMTYGGQNMTRVLHVENIDAVKINSATLFVLNNAGLLAATGNNFVLTWSSYTPDSIVNILFPMQNVDQLAYLYDYDTDLSTGSTSITSSLDGIDGGYAFVAFTRGDQNSSHTFTGTGWSELIDNAHDVQRIGFAEKFLTSNDAESVSHARDDSDTMFRPATIAAVISPVLPTVRTGIITNVGMWG